MEFPVLGLFSFVRCSFMRCHFRQRRQGAEVVDERPAAAAAGVSCCELFGAQVHALSPPASALLSQEPVFLLRSERRAARPSLGLLLMLLLC
ncbi:hypothetical protein AB852_02175 [Streptomyces uncialis]|uniref:Uncharacterized protein n=1 Tax=Streptomyces uncialis TaxID=1048205 RepID=A0A1Q4VCY4_9ACTN|nr:hypothetical protein AB852_02175 [Streptomyces uncialis]